MKKGKDFMIFPAKTLDYTKGLAYWKDLEKSDRLKYRMCDISTPNMEAVHRLLWYHGHNLYYVQMQDDIVGEFMLNNFTGKAAQIHFSTHPKLHMKVGIPLIKSVIEDIFKWKSSDTEEPYLLSLYGLTPVTNRAACIIVLKVGFKKKGILPGGMWFLGKPVDAMFTVRASNIEVPQCRGEAPHPFSERHATSATSCGSHHPLRAVGAN